VLQNSLWYAQWSVIKFRRGFKADHPFGMRCFSHPKMTSHGPNIFCYFLLVSAVPLVGGCHAERRRGCPERSSCGRRQAGGARARRMCCYKVQTDAESLCGFL
jgi:hypothetical protein